jgi:hypothetical protein
MKQGSKIEYHVPDKYFKSPSEDYIIGSIRYLREQGKACEFLGFNEYSDKLLGITSWHNDYVVLVDGIKYYGRVSGSIDTNYYATFIVVNDVEHDYIENKRKERVSQILEVLEGGK